MTTTQALLLGLIQGLTEFLPVSSSGHLVALEHFFDLAITPRDLQAFDILLHGATLLALLVRYQSSWKTLIAAPFRRDREGTKLLTLLVLATIPGATTGFLLEDWIAENFRSPRAVAVMFLVTAFILILAERLPQVRTQREMTVIRSILIGIAQACALLPGLSRAGLTMGAARALTFKRSDAVEFSFLLAAPIMMGAILLTLFEVGIGDVLLPSAPILVTGLGSAFISGLLAISFLRRFVALHSLAWFSLELIPLSLVLFLY